MSSTTTLSLAPAVVGVVLYGLTTIALTGRMIQYRAWFMTALIVGTVMETVGFGARSAAAINSSNKTANTMQTALTILAPIFTAAAEYIVLGRLMEYVGRQYSLIRPSLVSWLFIVSDAISFIIQVIGAIVLLSRQDLSPEATPQQIQDAQNKLNLGDNILLAGIIFSLASFAVFTVQIAYFHYRTQRDNAPNGRWRLLLWALYTSTALVLLRQIYRTAEFSQGWLGYLPTHEIYFYFFDALAIFLASTVYVWVWPSRCIPNDRSMHLGKDGNPHHENSVDEYGLVDASRLTM